MGRGDIAISKKLFVMTILGVLLIMFSLIIISGSKGGWGPDGDVWNEKRTWGDYDGDGEDEWIDWPAETDLYDQWDEGSYGAESDADWDDGDWGWDGDWDDGWEGDFYDSFDWDFDWRGDDIWWRDDFYNQVCYDPDYDGCGLYCVGCGDDCDSHNYDVNPLAGELCEDGLDNDCDGWSDCCDYDCKFEAACGHVDYSRQIDYDTCSNLECVEDTTCVIGYDDKTFCKDISTQWVVADYSPNSNIGNSHTLVMIIFPTDMGVINYMQVWWGEHTPSQIPGSAFLNHVEGYLFEDDGVDMGAAMINSMSISPDNEYTFEIRLFTSSPDASGQNYVYKTDWYFLSDTGGARFTSCGENGNKCGHVLECVNGDTPLVEICNGIDDDGDGILDGSEGLTRSCGTSNVGECAFGTETCTDAGTWTGCTAVEPIPEVCGNVFDEDCDGSIECGNIPYGDCDILETTSCINQGYTRIMGIEALSGGRAQLVSVLPNSYYDYSLCCNLIRGVGDTYCVDGVAGPGYCGDTTIDAGEECDDGNLLNWDGCSNECVIESTDPCSCTDVDLDGHFSTDCPDTDCSPRDDCDDTLLTGSDRYPGATEICGDGIDNDCVGGDEVCPCSCTDADGDGYYPTSCTDTSCSPGGDCDDTLLTGPFIYPGAQVTCSDLVDNDCDGLIDFDDPDCGGDGINTGGGGGDSCVCTVDNPEWGTGCSAENSCVGSLACFTCDCGDQQLCEGNACFDSNTLIRIASGTYKWIKDVKIGDALFGWNEKIEEIEEATVLNVLVHEDQNYKLSKITFDNGLNFDVTENHKIYVKEKGWVEAGDLLPGYNVVLYDKGKSYETKVVSVIEDYSEAGVVYNFKTTTGNYFANDILVHNKCLIGSTNINNKYGAKEISSIQPGEYVLGFVDGKIKEVLVTNVYKKSWKGDLYGYTFEFKDGGKITSTQNHIFVNEKEDVRAEELRIGDYLITEKGFSEIIDIEISKLKEDVVWDIRTESGNYYAENILVKEA